MMRRYFDWAATSPPDPSILSEALSSSLTLPGNPSSRHADGRLAREALENARFRCASVLGVGADTLFFTSGGTESNNLVLQSFLRKKTGRGMISSGLEHPSVTEPLSRLKELGVPVAYARASANGALEPEAALRAFSRLPEAGLLAAMSVNNETGAVTDIPALVSAARCSKKNVHVHCDSVQALGKVPIDLNVWDVDSASFSAHKIGGPRGIGLLYSRKKIEPLYSGGGQEKGVRAGTENLFGALAFAASFETYAAAPTVAEHYGKAALRWGRLIHELRSIKGCRFIPLDRSENDARFSPYILQASFDGIPGEVLVRALDDAGFSISTGSACSSSLRKRPVLEAMGVDEKTAFEAVRFSQGFATTDDDIGALLDALRSCIRSLK